MPERLDSKGKTQVLRGVAQHDHVVIAAKALTLFCNEKWLFFMTGGINSPVPTDYNLILFSSSSTSQLIEVVVNQCDWILLLCLLVQPVSNQPDVYCCGFEGDRGPCLGDT